jgi:microcystin-dependent protein
MTTTVAIGSIIIYTGDMNDAQTRATMAANGWLVCDGSALSSASYRQLYGVIGEKYNKHGDAAASFRLPDLSNQTINDLPLAYIIKYY